MKRKEKIAISFLLFFSFLLLANNQGYGSGQCVIITSSSWSSAFSNFIAARTSQRMTTFIYTLGDIEANYGGSDLPEKIRNYIIDASSVVTHVVLAGDISIVPTRMVFNPLYVAGDDPDERIACDYYYACLDSNWNADGDGIYGEVTDNVDLYPEVYVGRLSADTTQQANDIADKWANYDTTSWGKSIGLIGGNILASGDGAKHLEKEIYNRYLGGTNWNVVRVYEDYSPDNMSTSDIASCINSGVGIVIYKGHGLVNGWTPQSCLWDSGHVSSLLSNGSRIPVVFADCCFSGTFDSASDCLGEYFLRGSTNGTIGYISACESSYAGVAGSDGLLKCFIDKLIEKWKNRERIKACECLNQAKEQLLRDLEGIPISGGFLKTFYQFNFLGDPTAEINLSLPSPDGISPDISNVVLSSYTIVAGQSVAVSAEITDNDDLRISSTTIIKPDTNVWISTMAWVAGSDHTYGAIFAETVSTGTYNVTILSEDIAGNTTSSPGGTFEVLADTQAPVLRNASISPTVVLVNGGVQLQVDVIDNGIIDYVYGTVVKPDVSISTRPMINLTSGDYVYGSSCTCWVIFPFTNLPGIYVVTFNARDRASNLSSILGGTFVVKSTSPPAAVTDLTASAGIEAGEIVLTWTAPGDDGAVGTAYEYDIRYSTFEFLSPVISTTVFSFANSVGDFSPIPFPLSSGSPQTMTVTGLIPGTTYYFALRTADSVYNWSGLSNGVTAWARVGIPDITPPEAITTLSASAGSNKGEIKLTWLAPGDDGASGTIDNGEFKIQSSTWTGVFWSTGNALVSISASSVNPETFQYYVFNSLILGVTYYFKIWTRDENFDNRSSESNIAGARAQINPPSTGYIEEIVTAEGLKIIIQVPKTAFALPTTISIEPVGSSHLKFDLIQEADARTENSPVTFAYEFVLRDSYGNILGADNFLDKVRITFTYPGCFDLAQENQLRIFRLNESARPWEGHPGHKIDVAAKTISLDVDHFSVYRVMLKVAGSLDELIVYPNPFKVKGAKDNCIKFINLPNNVSLRIYNIAGETVYKKVYDNTSGGITWDGKNDSNRRVAAGVYIYFLEDKSGHTKTGKISVIP